MTVFVSGTRIPDSLSGIVDSKSPGLRIRRAKFSGFQIPQARFPYMVRTIRQHNNVLLWTFYGNSKLTAECLSLSRRKLQPCILHKWKFNSSSIRYYSFQIQMLTSFSFFSHLIWKFNSRSDTFNLLNYLIAIVSVVRNQIKVASILCFFFLNLYHL